ncbi:hypothetical protein MMC06_002902 [Schaereria dolodes]|nr:hypothetical protein [Schaereria dolodes]
MKALLSTRPWQDDCEVMELPWLEEKVNLMKQRRCANGERNGKLVFGIMKWDGHVQPHPPIQRAMRLVADALRERGYDIIEWSPPPHSPAVDILFQIFGCTAGSAVRKAINDSGEPPVNQLRSWFNAQENEPSFTSDFWTLRQQREDYRAEYNKYWNSTREHTFSKRPVDAVILPVAPSAAVHEGRFTYYAYSAIAKMLDYTSGSFPVTFADRSLDSKPPDYIASGSIDGAAWQTYQADDF